MKDAAQNKVVLQSNCTWKAEPPQRPNTGRCLFEICKKSQNTLGIKTTKKKIGTSRANTVEVGAASSWKGEWGWNDFPYSLMRYIDIHIYLYFFFFFKYVPASFPTLKIQPGLSCCCAITYLAI